MHKRRSDKPNLACIYSKCTYTSLNPVTCSVTWSCYSCSTAGIESLLYIPARLKVHNWFICVVNEFCVKPKPYAGVLYVVSLCNYGLIYFHLVVIVYLLWFPCFLVFLVHHSKYNDHSKDNETSCHSSWNWWSNDDHIITRGSRRERSTAVFRANTLIWVHRMTEELNRVKDTTVMSGMCCCIAQN